jgi:hypothetical protein
MLFGTERDTQGVLFVDRYMPNVFIQITRSWRIDARQCYD